MIVKIQPPNPGILAAVRYNENKAKGIEGPHPDDLESLEIIEDGHVVATRNVPEGSTLTDEFERLRINAMKKRRSGPAIQNTTFHMSVNPAKDDRKLTEEESVHLIDEIMQSLGYGDQPYRIYKHTDIPRQHYHVVSCRAGQNGKKIEDSFERMKLRRALQNLSNKYGFEIILNEYEKEKSNLKEKTQDVVPIQEKSDPVPEMKPRAKRAIKEPDTKKITFVPSFSRKSATPVKTQMRNIAEDALRWHFSTFEQLQLLMRKRYNISLDLEGDEDNAKVVMAGTSDSGKTITPYLYEKDYGVDLLNQIRERIRNEKMSQRKEQCTRLETLTKAAAAKAATYKEFLQIMEKKGVWVVPSWKTGSNDFFGLTYLDRATKCAWKGSQTAVDLAWLKETAEKKGWTIERDELQVINKKRNSRPSRTEKLHIPPKRKPASQVTPNQPAHKGKRFQAGHQRGSDDDVNRRKDDLLDKKDNKPKEYIGE